MVSVMSLAMWRMATLADSRVGCGIEVEDAIAGFLALSSGSAGTVPVSVPDVSQSPNAIPPSGDVQSISVGGSVNWSILIGWMKLAADLRCSANRTHATANWGKFQNLPPFPRQEI
jgi:hypothetical protein